MPRLVPIAQIDAFTDRPFAGNPAAVCFLDAPLDPAVLQAVAAEMNLSETAFLHPQDDEFELRWFTPTVEVDLCGHATLAAAHFLWTTGRLPETTEARFSTRSGRLSARRTHEGIAMDFPAEPVRPGPPPDGLAEALGVPLGYTGVNRMDWLVELSDEAVVRGLVPDLERLARIETRAVIVTAASEETGVDFVSRVFAPAFGIPEDPVTGSAHCALGPFWAERLGRLVVQGRQVSARGGRVGVRVSGTRVELSGRAVTVLEGMLRVPEGEGAG